VACPKFAFLGISGVNVDDDETSVLECFQKICGSCLLNKQIYVGGLKSSRPNNEKTNL
jgi:hypothetical protein